MGKGKISSRGNVNLSTPPEEKPMEEGSKTSNCNSQFSVFHKGYVNKEGRAVPQVIPAKTTTLQRVFEYITSNMEAKEATMRLRTISDHDENSSFKVLNFYAATFSGVFEYRKASKQKGSSGEMVLDIDKGDLLKAFPDCDIETALKKLKRQFIEDQLLCAVMVFISPNGNGLKVVIHVGDMQGLSHKDCFAAISEYVLQRYGVETDKSGSNIDRLCFLPYDPECYLRPANSGLFPPGINLHAWLEECRLRCDHRRTTMSSIRCSRNADSVFSLVESWVSRDVAYAEGSFNSYVSRCGYLLCNFGIPESEAEEWAVSRFADYESRLVKGIIQSCYRNGSFGTKTYRVSNQN